MNPRLRPVRQSLLIALLAVCVAIVTTAGCSRAYWRRQADAEAYALVREKATHPHWSLDGGYSIGIDPRSRMYDPYSPDSPPLPEDDPTAHEFMHCVDGKRGYPGWHDDGLRDGVENPAWMEYLQFDENGRLVVTADDAVRLGLLNSREYQSELETLYLSALDVSFERFRFDTQGFAGYELFYTADGRRRTGSGQSSSLLQASTFSSGQRDWALQKAYTTGSTLVVGFANSLVWQFSGPDEYSSNTLIDFALVQPLLRNAGRDRIMERLTVAERTLLYNVRAMEQYRQGFNLQVTIGRNAGAGPNRRGGVFGAGLEGFTGVGGGFGGVGGGGGGGATATGGGGAGAAQVGGYIGLLQDQQQIRNQEDNVERLRANLFRLEELLAELKTRSPDPTRPQQLTDDILRQDLQVAQARQALFNSESTLLNSRSAYQETLDQFKLTLGIPPTLCLDVRDNLLDQFQFIDRESLEDQQELERLTAEFGAARLRISQHIVPRLVPDPTDPTRTKEIRVMEWYDELEQDLADLKKPLGKIREIQMRLVKGYLPRVKEDLNRFEEAIGRRKAAIQRLQAMIEAYRQEICPLLPAPDVNREVFEVERLDAGIAELRKRQAELSSKIATDYETHISQREGKIDEISTDGKTYTPEKLFAELYEGVLYPKRIGGAAANPVPDIFVVMPSDILALQLVQARARTESVELKPVDMRAEQALEIARRYRRDWMNARAALVDSWRLIRFNADQLQSSLNIFFSGDIGNTTDNPFSLNSDTGRLRVGAQFDAPITRQSERNTYRQALIEYQQARRNYYAFEDGVARVLRQEVRNISNQQINFELQRLAVLEAARQIDRNEDIRNRQAELNQATGVTAARDAVSALQDLLTAQNNFMAIWVNYEAQRRSLDFDLGTMVLDNEGLWCDPGEMGPDYGQNDPWLRKEASFVLPDGTTIPLGPAEELPPAAPGAAPPAAAPHEKLPDGTAPPPQEARQARPRLNADGTVDFLSPEEAQSYIPAELPVHKTAAPPRRLPTGIAPPPVLIE